MPPWCRVMPLDLRPYGWSPSTVDIQVGVLLAFLLSGLRIDAQIWQLCEGCSTRLSDHHSGRRLRAAVCVQLISSGIIDNSAYFVVAGLVRSLSSAARARRRFLSNYSISRHILTSTPALPFLADISGHTPSDAAPPELTSSAISTDGCFDVALSRKSGRVLIDIMKTSAYHAGDGANPWVCISVADRSLVRGLMDP
ncbi:hypothetical protein B0H17DRAFT_215898 [Mycena rosella]|uniref:Uncharacterized protein n=1 Tax=Mycena rosella TaxID=1033263 RepID=A0AAD7CYX8_MYCRO|nr:hypothetical protein B0H17DRAFT_215898 [Mycena rosella]